MAKNFRIRSYGGRSPGSSSSWCGRISLSMKSLTASRMASWSSVHVNMPATLDPLEHRSGGHRSAAHIDRNARVPSVRSSSCSAVVISRVPVEPTG